MSPRLDPRPTLLAITVVLATFIHFPVLWCSENGPYEICGQSVQCGGIEIEYPFWGFGRPKYCGHPGFQLTCQSDVPVLILDSVVYQLVLDPDTSTHTINVARNYLWTDTCPQYLHNTTYNTTLFNGDSFDQENVSLYYGCQNNIPVPLGANYQFPCDVNDNQTDNYFYMTSLIVRNISNFLVQCKSSITVPVDKSWGKRLGVPNASVNYLRSALQAGFKLQWIANNDDCKSCIESYGRCGSNATSPELFACYKSGGGSSETTSRKLIIGISCGFIGIIMLFVILCRKVRLGEIPKGSKFTNHQIEVFIRNNGNLAPKRYEYSEIKKMSNSFLEKLGRGGYGSVYKGQLPDGRLVAVKLLDEATGNGQDFINEVAIVESEK